ncbi:MAG: DUF427 domain-containing protein [Actinobacteria bacterium]|nr:DUF427 domain-containing protein [Actinomycetota bacterium]
MRHRPVAPTCTTTPPAGGAGSGTSRTSGRARTPSTTTARTPGSSPTRGERTAGSSAFYSLEVDGEVNPDAVWFYPEPMAGAESVADRAAFWRGPRAEQ